MSRLLLPTTVLALLFVSSIAMAKTYQVGPTRPQKNPTTAFMSTLKPGDVVEIDGNQTYAGFAINAQGTAAAPIILRGIKVNSKRPIIKSSGGFTVHNDLGAHIVFESLEITGGNVCYRHHGSDAVLRDVLIHHCRDGVLGTDEGSGSLTMEYCELHNNGQGDSYHQIYMATDEKGHPGSVFRLQFSYVHDGVGGNNVKSRSERNEIYYNWIEGARYHEVELIGPDSDPSDPQGNLAPREDSDVVGNVLYSKTSDGSTVRVGGDGTGGTQGRYRFVNNTFLLTSKLQGAAFRLFQKLESIEIHNNVFYMLGGGAARLAYQQGLDSNWDIQTGDSYVWKNSKKVIGGANNWVSSTITAVPTQLTGTIKGTDPGFTKLGPAFDLRPKAGSPLLDKGVAQTVSPAGYAFPKPLPLPVFTPPDQTLLAVGGAQARTVNAAGVDIGAFEGGGAPQPPKQDSGTPPPGDGTGPRQDGSTPTSDGATSSGDGGSGDGGSGSRPSEGCGCDSTPTAATAGGLALALLFGLLLWRRRVHR